MRARGAFSKRKIKMDETPVPKERSGNVNAFTRVLFQKMARIWRLRHSFDVLLFTVERIYVKSNFALSVIAR